MDQVEQQAEPHKTASVWHHISCSLFEMALIAAVVVRILHVVFNAHGPELDWHSFVGSFVAIPVILLAVATVHLSNFPLHQWVWRAPAFALLEGAIEAILSLGLIYAGRERWGTGRAELGDWPAMAGTTLLARFLMICAFALVLGGVAQFIRRRELREMLAERHREQQHGDG